MFLKLNFTENSPFDTTLVDEASGAALYQIETQRDPFIGKTVTVIRKVQSTNRPGEPVPHPHYIEVAEIQWKSWSSDMVVYDGCEMRIEKFMPLKGFFNRCFVIAANGKEYQWSTSGHLPKLVTKDSEKEFIAKLHQVHRFLGSGEAFLEVAPAGLDMLDLIVVSLVYVETQRRASSSHRSMIGAAAGGFGGGVFDGGLSNGGVFNGGGFNGGGFNGGGFNGGGFDGGGCGGGAGGGSCGGGGGGGC